MFMEHFKHYLIKCKTQNYSLLFLIILYVQNYFELTDYFYKKNLAYLVGLTIPT
jgi:hypothetical protein